MKVKGVINVLALGTFITLGGIVSPVSYADVSNEAEKEIEKAVTDKEKEQPAEEEKEEIKALKVEDIAVPVLRTEALEDAMALNKEIIEEIERTREERKQKKIEEEKKSVQFVKQTAKEVPTQTAISLDVTKPSNLTVAHIDMMLAGTGLQGLGHAYKKAEDEYGVNALVLVGLSGLESNWGNSRLAKDRHNIFGFQAYDSNVNAAKHFESKEHAILHVAEYLSINYLNPRGKYYNGATLQGMNVKYASDKEWHVKIANIMKRKTTELNRKLGR